MKKIAIYAAAALLLVGSRVGAAQDAPTIKTDASGIVSVTGTLGAENANEWVSLTVYKSETGTAGISAGTAGNLNWYDQVKANDKGEYEFNFKMLGERGKKYSFSVTTDELSADTKDFVYYPTDEIAVIQNVVDTAKRNNDAAALDGIIKTYKDYLQLDIAVYSALSSGGTEPSADQLDVCANVLGCDVSTLEKFKQHFEDCSKVKTLCNEADKEDYQSEMLAFIENDAMTAVSYFEDYTAEEKSAIIEEMMANDTFKRKFEMVSYLNEKILPKEATNATLWPELQKLVLSMAPEFSVDLTEYNNLSNSYGNNQGSVFQTMLETRSYSSCGQIISVFDAAVKATPVPSRTVDESGSGGFSGGGGSAVVMPTPVVPQETFPDIAGVSWAKDSIKKLFVKGVISGDEKGNFNPDANVTRAQYIKMIVSAIDMALDGKDSDFYDVAAEAWYHDYVVTASNAGIVSGIDENNFGPDLSITRQDAATMIKRAAELKGINLVAERAVNISDKNEIADYAKDAVETLYACNLLNGVGDGRFAPCENMTRAQAAVIISNFLDRLEGLN